MYISAHKGFSQLELMAGKWILGNDGVAESEGVMNHHHDRTSGFQGEFGFGIFVRMQIKSVSVIGGQVCMHVHVGSQGFLSIGAQGW